MELPKDIGEKTMTMAETMAEKHRQQGIQQGVQQGIQQGMQLGSYEEKLRIARKLLYAKMKHSDIMAITGLTEKELMDLEILV